MTRTKPISVAYAALVLMCLCTGLSYWMTPIATRLSPPDFRVLVPHSFGEWREVKTELTTVDPLAGQDLPRNIDQPYDSVLMRTYMDSRGHQVMLALAYGIDLRQEVKIHRPEVCYVAQGFSVLSYREGAFAVPGAPSRKLDGSRMLVQAPGRIEAVSFWMRIGNQYSLSPWETRWFIFKEGLRGQTSDGILVRVSQIVDQRDDVSNSKYEVQEQFVAAMIAAMPEASRRFLVLG